MPRMLALLLITLVLHGCVPHPQMAISVKDSNALHAAACKGDASDVNRLLAQGLSPNDRYWFYRKYDGGNALNDYIDCHTGKGKRTPVDLNLVELLLAEGADPNVANSQRQGRTPLMALAQSPWVPNRFAAMDLLLARGAKLEPHDRSAGVWSENPTIEAARSGDIETLRFLVDRGAPLRFNELDRYVFSKPYMRVCVFKSGTTGELTSQQARMLSEVKTILSFLFENGYLLQESQYHYLKNACHEMGDGYENAVFSALPSN